MVEAMAMGMPTVITDWGATTDYANTSNSWPVPVEGLSCVNSAPKRGNPAGVYAAHRWAEASVPELRKVMRILYTNTDPRIAQRAKAARATMRHYGYKEVNDIVESRLALVPEKYTVDPHGKLRDFYEDFMQRPPSDEEIGWADTHHRGWQTDGQAWGHLLCELCTRRQFLAEWDADTMASCGECGAPLTEALAPYVAEAAVCGREGVDLVMTYASDDDPAWAAERERRWTTLGFFDKHDIDTADAVAKARARAPLAEWLLRMSLRSTAAHASWVNRVFVVTDTPPRWLSKDESVVRVVPTAEIMDAAHLPTFNSHAVEANLHKIPGLGECYLYLNADYFFGRNASVDDFVDPLKGQYKIVLETDRATAAAGSVGQAPAAHDAAFKNANALLDRWAVGGRPGGERHFVPHAPHFFRRSLVEQLAQKAAAEFAATSSHRFRSFTDVHVAYLHAYYMLEQPDSFLARVIPSTEASPTLDKPTYTVYLFNKPGQPTSFYAELEALRVASQAGGGMPRFFSINDAMDDAGDDTIVTLVRDTLLAIFPTRSPFETDDITVQGLPNTDKDAACPAAPATARKAPPCPSEWAARGPPHPGGICTAEHAERGGWCEQTVEGRALRCRCCYPARLTWDCEYADGSALGSVANAADALVDPASFYKHTNWRGRSNSGLDVEAPNTWSGELQTAREAFEQAWGRCHTPGAVDVLIALPYDDLVPCPVREKMFEALGKLECGSPGFNLHLGLMDEWEPTLPADWGRRAAVARLRNRLLERFLRPEHSYVLWLDGGVVDYPADLVARLHAANPDGITAPLVLLEGSDTAKFHQRHCGALNCGGSFLSSRPHKFHDPRGFLVSGLPLPTDATSPLTAKEWPPYLGETSTSPVVECESVGVSYLAPASIYRQGDVVPRYFPTPFTEHFPVVHAAKYALGLRVVTDTSIRVFQAWLPHWGTGLESYNPPFDDTRAEWLGWLRPYLGQRLDSPALRRTPRPLGWEDE